MTDTSLMSPARLSTQERLWLAALGVALASLLGVAAWLEPSPSGMGTHQRLGLPPCTFVWLFGTRCPSCGMTTAWSHAVRGQWLGALKANVGGTLLAVVAIAACPWAIACAVRGRWLLRSPREQTLAGLVMLIVVLIAVVTLGDWIYRLADR